MPSKGSHLFVTTFLDIYVKSGDSKDSNLEKNNIKNYTKVILQIFKDFLNKISEKWVIDEIHEVWNLWILWNLEIEEILLTNWYLIN